jgi:hypothetical protein
LPAQPAAGDSAVDAGAFSADIEQCLFEPLRMYEQATRNVKERPASQQFFTPQADEPTKPLITSKNIEAAPLAPATWSVKFLQLVEHHQYSFESAASQRRSAMLTRASGRGIHNKSLGDWPEPANI